MSFTGSPAVGGEIAAAAGRNLVPVTLELGGKNAATCRERLSTSGCNFARDVVAGRTLRVVFYHWRDSGTLAGLEP